MFRNRYRDWYRDGYIERATNLEKMGRERERERERVYKGVIERNNKKIEKIDYLNKRDDRIDKLIWVFCKNGCVK